MSVKKNRDSSCGLAVLALAILVLPGASHAGDTPRIHPMKVELLHGVVVGTRTVPAYSYAIGASVNPVGEQRCLGLEKEIKETSTFALKPRRAISTC